MYSSVFFVLSCAVAITYMWLIPYITEFASPIHRKLHFFPLNSASFQHYELYDDNGWKEYCVHVNSENVTCLAFVSTDGHSQWMRFHEVNKTFSFRTPTSLMTAIRLECKNEVDFIFHKQYEWLVFPLLRENNQTFRCPQYATCTFDVSLPLQQMLIEKKSLNGLRTFVISLDRKASIEKENIL